MKILVCAIFVLAAVVAEPPRYRSARFRPEKETEGVSASRRNDGGPYPASGFRPQAEFVLPARQEVVPPATSYGVPADSYGAPFLTYLVPRSLDTEYGPPSEKSEGGEEKKEGKEEGGEEKEGEERDGGEKKGEAEELSEGENKEGGESREGKEGGDNKEEKKGGEGEREEKKKRPEVITTGAYYILLPDSQLQRVQFRTEDDYANMAYTARLQYSNEGRAPLYVYSAVPVPEYGVPASAPYVQWY